MVDDDDNDICSCWSKLHAQISICQWIDDVRSIIIELDRFQFKIIVGCFALFRLFTWSFNDEIKFYTDFLQSFLTIERIEEVKILLIVSEKRISRDSCYSLSPSLSRSLSLCHPCTLAPALSHLSSFTQAPLSHTLTHDDTFSRCSLTPIQPHEKLKKKEHWNFLGLSSTR